MMPFELSGQMHILDMNTLEIIASTEDHVIGLNLEEEAGGLDLVRTMKENSHLSYQGQRYCIYAQEYGDYLLIRSYLSTYSLYAGFWIGRLSEISADSTMHWNKMRMAVWRTSP